MLRVQVAGRFVSQHNPGLMHNRACYRYPLLLTPRQLTRSMSRAMIHADEGQHFRNSFSNSAAFIASQQQREGDIFFNGQTGNKMKGLKDDSDALTAN